MEQPRLEAHLQQRLHVFSDPSLSREEKMWEYYKPGEPYEAPEVDVQDRVIPGGDGGDLRIRIYQVAEAPARSGIVLVWLHGGGFIGGSIDGEVEKVAPSEMVLRAGITVISPEYRLCNDGVTFPAPQADALATVRWAQAHLSEIHGHAVFVGGGSAGGCMAGSVVQMLRDFGDEQVLGALLLFPIAHARLPEFDPWLQQRHGALPPELAFDPKWALQHNERLMGRVVDSATGHDFPGDAADLTGLPPTLIINAEYDSLAVSGEAYGRQLARAGVEVTMYTEPAVTHGHLAYAPHELAAADHSIDSMIAFMRRHADTPTARSARA